MAVEGLIHRTIQHSSGYVLRHREYKNIIWIVMCLIFTLQSLESLISALIRLVYCVKLWELVLSDNILWQSINTSQNYSLTPSQVEYHLIRPTSRGQQTPHSSFNDNLATY